MNHPTVINYPGFDLAAFITRALGEDNGDGDHTSLACIPERQKGKFRLMAKSHGIIAGVELGLCILKFSDPDVRISLTLKDGSPVRPGDTVFIAEGNTRKLLGAERVLLNCMQRMSGIATKTNEMVKQLHGLKTKLLDTRKTTPGFRVPEKWAVKTGGGENHRMGLYDMILIKDNHIDSAGGIKQAIFACREYLSKNNRSMKVEVEARSIEDVKEIMANGDVDRIMLDNFSPEDIREAIELIKGQYITEASGNITRENIRSYAETGVDYISSGELTHSFRSLDLSFKVIQ